MSKPVGPYTPGVRAGDFAYTSGQVGIDTEKNLVEGFAAQCRQALSNLETVLDSVDCAPAQVIKTTVFLTDMDKYAEMNEIYLDFFGDHRPARSAVAVRALPLGAEVEIEAVAFTG